MQSSLILKNLILWYLSSKSRQTACWIKLTRILTTKRQRITSPRRRHSLSGWSKKTQKLLSRRKNKSRRLKKLWRMSSRRLTNWLHFSATDWTFSSGSGTQSRLFSTWASSLAWCTNPTLSFSSAQPWPVVCSWSTSARKSSTAWKSQVWASLAQSCITWRYAVVSRRRRCGSSSVAD